MSRSPGQAGRLAGEIIQERQDAARTRTGYIVTWLRDPDVARDIVGDDDDGQSHYVYLVAEAIQQQFDCSFPVADGQEGEDE